MTSKANAEKAKQVARIVGTTVRKTLDNMKANAETADAVRPEVNEFVDVVGTFVSPKTAKKIRKRVDLVIDATGESGKRAEDIDRGIHALGRLAGKLLFR